jgi:hypothetical protein
LVNIGKIDSEVYFRELELNKRNVINLRVANQKNEKIPIIFVFASQLEQELAYSLVENKRKVIRTKQLRSIHLLACPICWMKKLTQLRYIILIDFLIYILDG